MHRTVVVTALALALLAPGSAWAQQSDTPSADVSPEPRPTNTTGAAPSPGPTHVDGPTSSPTPMRAMCSPHPGYDCDGNTLTECADAQIFVTSLMPPASGGGSGGTTTPERGFGVRVKGNPETDVLLHAYTRPGTTPYTMGVIHLDSKGDGVYRDEPGGSSTIRKPANTRLWIHNGYPDCGTGYATGTISVSTPLGPITAVRNALLDYTFTGTHRGIAGKVLNLYRTPPGGGRIVLVSQTRLQTGGTWVIHRRFLGSGAFDLRVRAGDDINSAGGASPARSTVIH